MRFLTILLIISLGIAAVACSFNAPGFFAHPVDELYYMHYGIFFHRNGIQAYPLLLDEYLRHPTPWAVPDPFRIGFIAMAAAFMALFGESFFGMACLSLAAYLCFLIVSFYYTRKYFDEKTALAAALMLAFSPLHMAMARRALTESAAYLFLAFSFWLFIDFIRERRRVKTVLFVAAYTWAILIKETSVLLSGAFLVFLILRRVFLKEEVRWTDFLVVSAVPFALAGAVYVSAGSVSSLRGFVQLIMTTPVDRNSYNVAFCSGPWFRYIVDYTLLSPWVVLLGAGGLLRVFASKERQEAALYLAALVVVMLLLVNRFEKNVRYVMILDMPLRLLSVLMLKDVVLNRISRHGWAVVAGLVILIACGDYAAFRSLFLDNAIYDPVSFNLLRARQIIH